MKSFKINDFRGDIGIDVETLRRLYMYILVEDPEWHFFWEGDYTAVRCGDGFSEDVSNFLEKNGYKFTVDKWVDNIPITKKYQEQFKGIFHGFSEIAMRMDEDELIILLERICHCFLNNCFTNKGKIYELCGELEIPRILWESLAIHIVAIGRSYTVGFIDSETRKRKGG